MKRGSTCGLGVGIVAYGQVLVASLRLFDMVKDV